jgi:hypothetical protein
MGADKIFSRRLNSAYAPNSQPRVPTRVCQGSVVTMHLPTLGTNSNSKQHRSRTQEAKDFGHLRSPKRTVRVGAVDGLRVRGRQSKNGHRTSSMHPPKFGRYASSLRTIRSSWIVQPHRANGPTNNFQPKPTGHTNRNEATQELAKNKKNSRLLSSSRTIGIAARA